MKTLIILFAMVSTLLANIGEVTALQGKAQLSREAELLDISKGSKINNQDLLTTSAHSKAQVILNDDTVITIGPKSEYLFEHFQDGDNPEVTMRLNRGFFKTVTGKIGKIAPQRFKIKTKAATIGIRGTQFMASVQNDEEKIGCIKGVIVVYTKDGEYEIRAGKMIVYKEKKWQIFEMDMSDFAPVMVGMPLTNRYMQPYTRHLLPSLENSYLLQEQVLDQGEAFSFDFSTDASEQPPTFIP